MKESKKKQIRKKRGRKGCFLKQQNWLHQGSRAKTKNKTNKQHKQNNNKNKQTKRCEQSNKQREIISSKNVTRTKQ